MIEMREYYDNMTNEERLDDLASRTSLLIEDVYLGDDDPSPEYRKAKVYQILKEAMDEAKQYAI